MGDYDIEFVGSRMSLNRQQKLQSVDRLVAMAQVLPALQLVLPSIELAKELVGEMLELPELASQIGTNPQAMMANLMASQMMGGKGPAQNNVPPSSEPSGLLPAQAQGY